MPLTDTDLVSRCSGPVWAELDGGVVLMNVDDGVYYHLNSVASQMWRLLECPATVSDLCQRLIGEYDIDPAQCRAEVATFIEELIQRGLLTISATRSESTAAGRS